MKTRVGKIAQLPKAIREELNWRIENGQQGPELLDWLNGLPKVKKVLMKDYECKPINKQNLSEWRRGGYGDWLRHQERRAWLRQVGEEGRELSESEGTHDGFENLSRVMLAGLVADVYSLDEIAEKGERWERFRELSRELVRLQGEFHRGWRVLLQSKRGEREEVKLELNQARFQESRRRKLEVGLDALAKVFKKNPEALRLFWQARDLVMPEKKGTSKSQAPTSREHSTGQRAKDEAPMTKEDDECRMTDDEYTARPQSSVESASPPSPESSRRHQISEKQVGARSESGAGEEKAESGNDAVKAGQGGSRVEQAERESLQSRVLSPQSTGESANPPLFDSGATSGTDKANTADGMNDEKKSGLEGPSPHQAIERADYLRRTKLLFGR